MTVLTIVGTLWLWQNGRATIAVYELKAALPAFQVLKASDVVITTATPPKSGTAFASGVVGKYTTRDLAAGEPILTTDVGPEIDSTVVNDGAVIMGVPASSAQALAGRLGVGSRVLIASDEAPSRSYEIVLLSVDKTSSSSEKPYVLVMAVPKVATSLLPLLGTGDFILTVPLKSD